MLARVKHSWNLSLVKSQQPNLKMWHSLFTEQSGTFKIWQVSMAGWTRQSFIETLYKFHDEIPIRT
jgi:hypothetical protein